MFSPFGWELLVAKVENDLTCNEDVLLCFTHFVLISNGFKCIGLGESKTLEGNETKSEQLPNGWTRSYTMRYVFKGRLYNLKAIKVDDECITVNIARIDEQNIGVMQLDTSAVASRHGTLDEMLPAYEGLAKLVKTEVDKLIDSKKMKDGASQTEKDRMSAVLHRSEESDPVFNDDFAHDFRIPGFRPRPYGVGEVDLHPFGRNPGGLANPLGGGGGGMLFQPPMAGIGPGPSVGLPPGAVPPGARFDPFRPPDVDRFPPRNRPSRPDNDEMPPPGYDDMFM